MGGLLVLSDLNPYVLIPHFLTSFPLIYAAAALVHRTSRAPVPATVPLLRPLAAALVVATSLVLVLGTLVTGTGPHAGDPKVDRLPFDPRAVTQVHADAVFLLAGLTLAAVLVSWATPWRHWGLVVLGLLVAQGALGYTQYFNGVPAVLVALHALGASLVFTTASWLHVRLARPIDVPLVHSAAPSRERSPRNSDGSVTSSSMTSGPRQQVDARVEQLVTPRRTTPSTCSASATSSGVGSRAAMDQLPAVDLAAPDREHRRLARRVATTPSKTSTAVSPAVSTAPGRAAPSPSCRGRAGPARGRSPPCRPPAYAAASRAPADTVGFTTNGVRGTTNPSPGASHVVGTTGMPACASRCR